MSTDELISTVGAWRRGDSVECVYELVRLAKAGDADAIGAMERWAHAAWREPDEELLGMVAKMKDRRSELLGAP